MTKEEINRTIHEAMGLCWHELETQQHMVVGQSILTKTVCKFCGKYHTECRNLPDYTSKLGFWDAWNWAKRKGWWSAFYWTTVNSYETNYETEKVKLMVNPRTFAATLAEYLKECNHAR